MSLIIFFGMASIILVAGLFAIGVTVFHWHKQNKLKSKPNTQTAGD